MNTLHEVLGLAGVDLSSEAIAFDAADQRLSTDSVDEAALAEIDALAGWDALGPEALQLHRDVRALLADRWLGRAASTFLAGTFSRDLFLELGSLGALGAGLVGDHVATPREKLAVFAVMHALEWGDGGLRCAVTIQDSVIQALLRFGTAEQQARWVPRLVSGEAVASFALTEPQAGSDLRAVSTRARRVGGDWVLDGAKSWVTNAPAADLILVWARSGEANDDLRGFLVERGAVGLTVDPIRNAAALRAATLGRLTLDGVRVPSDSLLPHAWGLGDINACLDYNRMTVSFGVMGAARFCLEAAITHAREREQFGAPIGTRQLVQSEITEMVTRVVLGEMLSIQSALRWSARAPRRLEVSLLKRHNCAAARDVAARARSVLGARGIDLESHVARHMLNLEASYSYGGTHEIHGLVVAKSVLGLGAF